MQTFSKSGVKYNLCNTIESFYCVGFKSNPIINPNASLFFDGANGYFKSSEDWNFGDLLFFYNGLLQNKVSDYLYSSKFLLKPNSSYLDEGVIDSLSHEYNIQSFVSGDLISGSIAAANNGNSILFLNGYILISGLDYISDAGNFVMQNDLFEASSGVLTEIKFEEEISVALTSEKFLQTGFYDNYLMCFVDRKRKPISQFSKMSSVEIGFNTSSLGCFSGDLIYGNEGNYFEDNTP
jgi:hypothetical protein